MSSEHACRILIADDHPTVRLGIRRLIETHSDMQLVAEAEDGTTAVDLTILHKPDVVIMDVNMPRLDGISATLLICRVEPATRILVLSTDDSADVVCRAIAAGAAGFLPKQALPGALAGAVHAVRDGTAFISISRAGHLWEM